VPDRGADPEDGTLYAARKRLETSARALCVRPTGRLQKTVLTFTRVNNDGRGTHSRNAKQTVSLTINTTCLRREELGIKVSRSERSDRARGCGQQGGVTEVRDSPGSRVRQTHMRPSMGRLPRWWSEHYRETDAES